VTFSSTHRTWIRPAPSLFDRLVVRSSELVGEGDSPVEGRSRWECSWGSRAVGRRRRVPPRPKPNADGAPPRYASKSPPSAFPVSPPSAFPVSPPSAFPVSPPKASSERPPRALLHGPPRALLPSPPRTLSKGARNALLRTRKEIPGTALAPRSRWSCSAKTARRRRCRSGTKSVPAIRSTRQARSCARAAGGPVRGRSWRSGARAAH
jgi:hypothetical protein